MYKYNIVHLYKTSTKKLKISKKFAGYGIVE